MPGIGFRVGGSLGRPGQEEVPKKKTVPTDSFGNPSTFTAAANTQAKDYDKIMAMYDNLYKSQAASPLTSSNIVPQLSNYSRSPEVGESLSNLSELSRTGGYDEQGIADLRARGISPIRSIYANAKRELDRSRNLTGGYSPNYNATAAKMAREQSDLISKKTTDVNAEIAQNVATNRLNAAPNYSNFANRENEARTGVDSQNAQIVNMINQFNEQMKMDAQKTNKGLALNTVEGMRGLYGTTPALTKTFGDQVGQAANITQSQQQIDEQKQRDLNSILPRFRNG